MQSQKGTRNEIHTVELGADLSYVGAIKFNHNPEAI